MVAPQTIQLPELWLQLPPSGYPFWFFKTVQGSRGDAHSGVRPLSALLLLQKSVNSAPLYRTFPTCLL